MLEAAVRPGPATCPIEANRTLAHLAVSARLVAGETRLGGLREGGGYRIKFPAPARGLEAVLVNTGGGLLGGDRLSLDVTAEAGADLMLTTQSAEKVYRAVAAPAEIELTLKAETGARLHWLPQESILFSGARLQRQIEADVAGDAELLIVESAVFGRIAMGEVPGIGALADRWRIRRDGRLAFADDLKLDGQIAQLLDRPALGGGARATASLVLMAPDAEARLEAARATMETMGVAAGASAWDGKLVIRMLAVDPAPMRQCLARLIAGLSGRPLPRFW
ncbi:MAG: urease accessory protein UreD [Proteobacteria bacterium]|nr:urease accessory protein UreD [Pseudomonadota bacterium]